MIRKSTDQGDGSIYRRLICRRCSTPWRLVIDPDSNDWNCFEGDMG
jgi:hypothetical protein